MRIRISIFIVRWFFNSLGLWVALRLLGSGYDIESLGFDVVVGVFLVGGLIFSLLNAVLKPIMVILSLPVIVFSLGLFMIILNGLLVYWSIQLTPGLSMSFLNSILTGLLLSLINYIVGALFEKPLKEGV